MTYTPPKAAPASAASCALGEVRAQMARQEITVTELAARIDAPPHWVRRRVAGAVQLTVDDLDRLAHGLDLELSEVVS